MSQFLITKAREYAFEQHGAINQLYDGAPYSTHLHAVATQVATFGHLLDSHAQWDTATAAAYIHDVIEDCRVTYNDVDKVLGQELAELAYVLATPKGRNRAERHCDAYYVEISQNKVATFVKICDRLANVAHSVSQTSSSMLDRYRKEQAHFCKYLEPTWPEFAPLWSQLDRLFLVQI